MPGGLPEVTQAWTADVSDYIAEMSKLIASTKEAAAEVEALQRAIDELHGKQVNLGVDTAAAQAAAAVNDLANATNDLAGAEGKANAVGQSQIEMTRLLAESEAMEAESVKMVTDSYAQQARDAKLLIETNRAIALTTVDVVTGQVRAADATDQAGTAATRATGAYYGWWGVLGRLNQANFALYSGVLGTVSGLHLLVDAVAEVISVVVPAGIALAAFGVAAAPTIGDIVTRMKNLYTVTTATGQALYPMTGAFSAMADAVRPQVYQLFGDALLVVTRNAGVFTTLAKQTGTVLDQLGARLSAALTSGNGFNVFLRNAVNDVAKLGDIVGNLGGILGNVLRTVPGYAQYMLNFADGVTKVGEAVTGSGIVQGLMRFGLAAHGAIIYTGLLATMAAKVLTGFGRFPGLLSLASDALAAGALGMEKFAGEGNIATRALGSMSSEVSLMQGWSWGWIALGAAAVGVLAYKFITAKDAADQFITSFNTGLARAPLGQVMSDISAGITTMSSDMAGAKTRMDQFSGATLAAGRALAPIAPGVQDVGNWFTRLNDTLNASVNSLLHFNLLSTDNQQNMARSASGAATAVHDYQAYQAEIATLNQESVTFRTRLGELAVAFGGTAQAMGVLTAAGITAGQMMDKSPSTWAKIIVQVDATVAAYRAMGQAGGVLGADMNAMTIASSDQVSAMTNLNHAFDTTIGIVSGGQSAFIGFEQAMRQGTSAAGGVAAAAKVAGASMTGLNTQSLNLRAAWQNAYTSGASLVDALRMMISISPNAASQNHNLTQSMKDVITQLSAEGDKSKATRAELVSLANTVNPAIHNFSELKKWLGDTGNAAQDLQKRLANMGVNVQDLANDAAHLSSTMNSQLTSAFSAAKLQANGTQTAIQNLAKAVGTNASAAQQSQAKLTLFSYLVHKDGMSAQQAAALISALTGQIFKIPTAHHTNITTNAAQVIANMASVQGAINALHGKTITITTIENVISNTTILQHVVSASGAHSGFQHGGVLPGFQPGVDSVHAMLSPGEGVLNPYAVRMLGSGWVHAVNRIAESGGSVNPAALRAGVSGPGGGGAGAAVIHNHIILDGREIATSVRRHEWQWQTRSSGVRSGLSIPGTRVG
jgi:hypothetical protein